MKVEVREKAHGCGGGGIVYDIIFVRGYDYRNYECSYGRWH